MAQRDSPLEPPLLERINPLESIAYFSCSSQRHTPPLVEPHIGERETEYLLTEFGSLVPSGQIQNVTRNDSIADVMESEYGFSRRLLVHQSWPYCRVQQSTTGRLHRSARLCDR